MNGLMRAQLFLGVWWRHDFASANAPAADWIHLRSCQISRLRLSDELIIVKTASPSGEAFHSAERQRTMVDRRSLCNLSRRGDRGIRISDPSWNSREVDSHRERRLRSNVLATAELLHPDATLVERQHEIRESMSCLAPPIPPRARPSSTKLPAAA